MTFNLSYIKTWLKYIIGITVIATGLNFTAFGDIFPNEDGIYEISSAKDLLEFSKGINRGTIDNRSKAILMEDIELNDLKIEDNKIHCVKINEKWEPIGTKEIPFNGEFVSIESIDKYRKEIEEGEISDINTKTISGLYISNPYKNYIGLFGYIGPEGKVSNIKVTDSYFRGNRDIGAITGCNYGTIDNCFCENVLISGNENIGGNVGRNGKSGVITILINYGSYIEGEYENLGGNIGMNFGKVKTLISDLSYVDGYGCNVGGNIGINIGTIKKLVNCDTYVISEGSFVGGNAGINEGIIEKNQNNTIVTGGDIIGGNIGCNNGGIIGTAINSGDVDIIKETKKQIIGGNIGWNKNKGKIIGDLENKGLINGKINGMNIGYKKHD